jgi:CRP-like cAMP-binding protein
VSLAETRGVPIGTLIMIEVGHGELAAMVDADPEETSRALARLHGHGWVLPGTDRLHVVNAEALARVAASVR